MAVGDAHVFPGFLTPVLTQLFFPKPPTTFLTCFCRGERRKYAGKKSCLNRGIELTTTRSWVRHAHHWATRVGLEHFLRISSCLYSAKSPHSPEPCLGTDHNFANNIWKGSPKEHSCEIILKSDQRFQRRFFMNFFFMSILCKNPPFTRAMFMDRSKFHEQFLIRVTQGTFLWNYFKIGPADSEKKIF